MPKKNATQSKNDSQKFLKLLGITKNRKVVKKSNKDDKKKKQKSEKKEEEFEVEEENETKKSSNNNNNNNKKKSTKKLEKKEEKEEEEEKTHNDAKTKRTNKKHEETKKPKSFARKPINESILVANPWIRVVKLYGRFDKEAKKNGLIEWPKPTNDIFFENYGICSGHPMKELSPMKLGPVVISGKLFAKNIEDGWQGSKVWSQHLTNGGYFDQRKPSFWVPGNTPMDSSSDQWIPEWTKWSQYIRMSGLGKRRHFKIDRTRGNTNIPLFQYFQGKRFSYVEARKLMYVQWYYELVQQTSAFQYLKQRFQSGTCLNLLEFDGIQRKDQSTLPDPVTPDTLKQFINDPRVVFGHGMVLAAALLECRPWED